MTHYNPPPPTPPMARALRALPADSAPSASVIAAYQNMGTVFSAFRKAGVKRLWRH